MSKGKSDKSLVLKSIAGDEEAFGALYDLYVQDIYRFVLMRVRSQEDAQDLTSDAFLKMWQYLTSDTRSIDNFRALLYRIARNLIIDFYRQSGKEFVGIDEGQMETIQDHSINLERKAEIDDDIRMVLAHLDTLDEEHRELILMKYAQDLSTKEIAHIVDKKPGAVRVALHRSIKLLKERVRST